MLVNKLTNHSVQVQTPLILAARHVQRDTTVGLLNKSIELITTRPVEHTTKGILFNKLA